MIEQVQTQVGSEITFKGITYKSYRNEQNNCTGCDIFEGKSKDYSMCAEVSCSHVIWIKKEKLMNTTEHANEAVEVPQYTVEEVLLSLEYLNYYNPTDAEADNLKQYLAKQSNPDYKLYLELKAKFGE